MPICTVLKKKEKIFYKIPEIDYIEGKVKRKNFIKERKE